MTLADIAALDPDISAADIETLADRAEKTWRDGGRLVAVDPRDLMRLIRVRQICVLMHSDDVRANQIRWLERERDEARGELASMIAAYREARAEVEARERAMAIADDAIGRSISTETP